MAKLFGSGNSQGYAQGRRSFLFSAVGCSQQVAVLWEHKTLELRKMWVSYDQVLQITCVIFFSTQVLCLATLLALVVGQHVHPLHPVAVRSCSGL